MTSTNTTSPMSVLAEVLDSREVLRYEEQEYGDTTLGSGVVTFTLDEERGLLIRVGVHAEFRTGDHDGEYRYTIEVLQTTGQVNDEGDATYERSPLPSTDVTVDLEAGMPVGIRANSSTSTFKDPRWFQYAGTMLMFVQHVARHGINTAA